MITEAEQMRRQNIQTVLAEVKQNAFHCPHTVFDPEC